MYFPVAEEITLAGRLFLGVSEPLGDADALLPNYRFFAGGVNTHRGFERRELGPTDTAGNPVGGEAKFLTGAELRFPFWRALGGLFFVDTGQVWLTAQEFSFTDLQVAVGPGLVARTPVGPITLGYSRLLTDPPPGRPQELYYFTIGYSY